MANEPGRAQLVNRELCSWIVVLISITSARPDVSLFGRMRQRGWESRMPFGSSAFGVLFRVAYFGRGALNGWWLSSKAKYWLETDRKQVPWGKGEKDFGKRVKSVWNRWEGSEWNQFIAARLPWESVKIVLWHRKGCSMVGPGFLRCFSSLQVNVSWAFDEICCSFLSLLRRSESVRCGVLSRLRTACGELT